MPVIYSRASKQDLAGVSFNCGQEYIDRYFSEKMFDDDDAVPYCFWTDEKKQDLVGIASLSCSGIVIKSHEHFNITPAVEVKIFAVDEKYQHKVFPGAEEDGDHWSDYCWYYLLDIIYGITECVCGASHVVLYSVPEAVSFYKRNHLEEFSALMTKPSNMFIGPCVPMFLNL